MKKSVMIYSLHIGITLRDGRKKWPKCGAIVRMPDGNIAGNIELRPFNEHTPWDGRFILIPPEKNVNGAVPFKEPPDDTNVEEMPI